VKSLINLFIVTFPNSKVTTYVFLPPLVTFILAFFGAMAGVTGAFLLLPFQMSILGYTSAGVSATNFLYNVVAIPGTVYRYTKERRMNWPLAFSIIIGCLPGIIIGYWLRITIFSTPKNFKPFVGIVLLYLAWRMYKSLKNNTVKRLSLPSQQAVIKTISFSLKEANYSFDNKIYSFSPIVIIAISFIVGIIGGAYGIGGGAIMAPFFITVLDLPVHSIAGASLFGTLVSSIVGVVIYQLGIGSSGVTTHPDYLLGLLFGLGGLIGGYFGAKMQRKIPDRPIKLGLLLVLVYVSFKYLYPVIFK